MTILGPEGVCYTEMFSILRLWLVIIVYYSYSEVEVTSAADATEVLTSS